MSFGSRLNNPLSNSMVRPAHGARLNLAMQAVRRSESAVACLVLDILLIAPPSSCAQGTGHTAFPTACTKLCRQHMSFLARRLEDGLEKTRGGRDCEWHGAVVVGCLA